MKKYLPGLLILFSHLTLTAQFLIPSTASEVSNNTYAISWSVGEIAIETIKNKDLHLTQGFHQSWLKITRTETSVMKDVFLSLYPNPVEHTLYLEWKGSYEPMEMIYKVININGKLLFSILSSSPVLDIDMSTYPAGVYTLIVTDSKLKEHSWIYKLIKH